MGEESVAIVGRNGMGKTTLCAAIMGLMPPRRRSGSITFRGTEILGKPSYKIAGARDRLRAAGPAPVPVADRRRAPADDLQPNGGNRWTADKVYELFPRLAERKKNGGAQLSGGEQQMLAIGRALLTNPKLLIMDEPSEGLAPAIIENLIEVFKRLEEEGLRILLIEQNLGVATSLAEAAADHGRRRDRDRDDGRRARRRSRTCSGATSASSRWRADAWSAPALRRGSRAARAASSLAGCGGGGEAAARPDLRLDEERRLRHLRDERRRQAAARG